MRTNCLPCCPASSSSCVFLPAVLRTWLSIVRRVALGCALLGMLSAAASVSAQTTQTLTVNTLSDSNDGSCGSTCSLRDAITQADMDTGDTITFSVTGTITLGSALPAISQNVTITGPTTGAGIELSGANKYEIFNIGSSATVAISNLMIALGTSTQGGGIENAGKLTVTGSTLTGNSVSGEGGAIANYGSLTVINSTFTRNTASSGGGIFNGSSSTLTAINSTFSANSDNIYNDASSAIIVENSLLTGNDGECSGTGCPTNGASGNVVVENAAQAKLLPLENYGGTTPTLLPLPGSPAIDAGNSSFDTALSLTTDQRGFALNSSTVDAGAVQTNYVKATSPLPGSFTGLEDLDLTGLSGTLILPEVSYGGALIESGAQINFIGPGAGTLTLSADNPADGSAAFEVQGEALFYGLTIANSDGGITNDGTLTALNCAISDNFASSEGGGIFNSGLATVVNSTIAGNGTQGENGIGGGIFNNSGTLTAINSTISGNSTGTPGGGFSSGIFILSGAVTLTNVTVSGNTGEQGAGILNFSTLTMANSIVEGNSAATDPDLDGTFTDEGGNLVNSGSSPVSANLAPLGSYGGPLQTMLPTPGSGNAAICAGEQSLAVDQYGIPLTTDERELPFGQSSYCTGSQVDAGAVQTDYTAVTFTNPASYGYTGIVNQDVSKPAAPMVSVTESGQNVGNVPVTLNVNASAGTATGTTATTVAGIGATFPSLVVNATGSDTVQAELLLTPTNSLNSETSVDLDIVNPVTLTTATLATGSVGTGYSYGFSTLVSGGTGGYTYALSGMLPGGLTFEDATGILSGTPTAQGTYPFVITATDSVGFSGSQSYTLQVTAATTSISLSSSSSTLYVGQSVTLTATISPASGTYSEGVAFFLNGTAIANCSSQPVLVSGGVATASCTVPNLAYNNGTAYLITASYPSGDPSHEPANSTLFSEPVSLNVTTTTVSSSGSSTVDQPVTFTALVTDTTGTNAPTTGTVNFTSNGRTIAGCRAQPLTLASSRTSQATCSTAFLAASSTGLNVEATYSGDKATYATSTSTGLSQVVSTAATHVTVATAGASTINQPATFTAAVSPTGPVSLSSTGTVRFSADGTTVSTCTAQPITPSTGQATCPISFSTAASHVVSAVYNGDSNYSATLPANITTVSQAVGKATTSVAIHSVDTTTSALGADASNVGDAVVFTAVVTPYSGTTPLTTPFNGAATVGGTVTFTANGATLCSGVAVSLTAGDYQATCTTSGLSAGSQAVVATYSGNTNYNGSAGNLMQTVQGYALQTSATTPITITQGYTNNSDPFTPQAVTVSVSQMAGFTGNLSLTCNVTAVTGLSGAVAPSCSLGSSLLAMVSGSAPQPVALTIDAGSGATPQATPGSYSVTITGVDTTTGVALMTASVPVNVRYQATPLTLASGSTTGNAATVDFTLPPNVGFSSLACSSVAGQTLTASATPASVGMSCGFNPNSIPATGALQNATVTVTVNTNAATTTAQLETGQTRLMMAGIVSAPLLLLCGWMPGVKSRKALLRVLGVGLVVIVLMQGTGCGGGSLAGSTSGSGQTSTVTYDLLVQGTGTDNQTYQAVIPVNVTR